MPTVGMIGNNASDMALVFLRMCQLRGYRAKKLDLANLNKNLGEDEIRVVCINENIPFRPVNILVVQDVSPLLTNAVSQLTGHDYLIIDTDRREIFPALKSNTAHLITYGFNNRACVTASSVTDQALQICLQRRFVSLYGHPREPQEFPAPLPEGIKVSSVLGAVTACVLCEII